MEIIWKHTENKTFLNHESRINLEYAVRLQVVKILIKEAEHLMNYLSLVGIQIDASNGKVSVHPETPEPLYSKISDKLVQPKAPNVQEPLPSLLATAHF
ncbi:MULTISPECIES: hypothetical protein [unclassified Allomuricauda]|uniref:hypothetical protein n=1 Tax=unclassified Allomuricauda TaxID=2615049 RepID=UPI00273FE948|nr:MULTISPECIES: hypothetical protein [unclassified Allomuricauda]